MLIFILARNRREVRAICVAFLIFSLVAIDPLCLICLVLGVNPAAATSLSLGILVKISLDCVGQSDALRSLPCRINIWTAASVLWDFMLTFPPLLLLHQTVHPSYRFGFQVSACSVELLAMRYASIEKKRVESVESLLERVGGGCRHRLQEDRPTKDASKVSESRNPRP
jgi:hypothetical protein